MRRMILLLLVLAGCSDGGGGGGNGVVLGGKPKGSTCTSSSECGESQARCLIEGPASACSGSLADGAFEQLCDGATEAAAATCPGLVCISLKANKQMIAGVCSAPCSVDGDCGTTGSCVPVLGAAYCFARCDSDAQCDNGLVCVKGSDGLGLCSVTKL